MKKQSLRAAILAVLLTSACTSSPEDTLPDPPHPTPPASLSVATSGEARSSSYQLQRVVGASPKASSPAHRLEPR